LRIIYGVNASSSSNILIYYPKIHFLFTSTLILRKTHLLDISKNGEIFS